MKDSRNVAVDQLDHNQGPIVGHDVKGLSLDIGILIRLPFQVLFRQLGVRSVRSLPGDRLDRLRAIDRLLRANGRRETVGGKRKLVTGRSRDDR